MVIWLHRASLFPEACSSLQALSWEVLWPGVLGSSHTMCLWALLCPGLAGRLCVSSNLACSVPESPDLHVGGPAWALGWPLLCLLRDLRG